MIPFLLPALLVMTGCGVTGDIRQFTLDYPPETGNGLERDIILGELSSAPDAGQNQAVGAYSLGKFGEKDRIKIADSLSSTLEQLNQGNRDHATVRVFIHRYAMAYSNDEFSVIAIVDWCIEEDGAVVFDEVFYASYYSGESFILPVETLGGSKDKVNRAIVRHIADRSFALYGKHEMPSNEELIHATAEEALSVVPESVDSSPTVASGIILGGLHMATFYEEVMDFEKIDWTKR